MLDKNKVLFERDEKGEVLPKKVFVEALKDDIVITPLSWGEWKRIRTQMLLINKQETSQEQCFELIQNHCVEPKFSLAELKALKPFVADAIENAIYNNSGIVADDEKKKDT